MAILPEVAEFIKSLRGVFENSKPEHVVVVLLGALAVGSFGGWWAKKLIRPHTNGAGSPSTPRPASEPDPLLQHIQKLRSTLGKDTQNSNSLWLFHHASRPVAELLKLRESSLKVVPLVNLKGGVAKTTCVANIGAHYALNGKKVLIIDLDYQGSASATLLRAAGQGPRPSVVDSIIAEGASGAMNGVVDLGHIFHNRLHLLPAGDTLNRVETHGLIKWLLDPNPAQDIRFNMARFLVSKPVQDQGFDLVLIDTPPRLTISTINALVAASHFVIPTIPDNLAIGNVGALLGQVHELIVKGGFNESIKFAGIVLTMTQQGPRLSDFEENARQQVAQQANDNWKGEFGGRTKVFDAWIPERADVGRRAGYKVYPDLFRDVANELAQRIGMQLDAA